MSVSARAEVAARTHWDRAVLAWLCQRDGAAQALSHACLELAAAQPAQPGWVFWSLGSTFFHLLAQQAGTPDLPGKRLVSRLWRQYGQALPDPALAQELGQWLAAHGTLLELADLWSARLEAELTRWAAAVETPLPEEVPRLTQGLAACASALALPALGEVLFRLTRLLPLDGQAVPAVRAQAELLASAARHARQLLHQHAAGVDKAPNAQLLADLEALAQGEKSLPQT